MTNPPFTPEPFHARTIRPVGLRALGGRRIKVYEITRRGERLRPFDFESGIRLAQIDIQRAPADAASPPVGFMILHQGAGWNYVVLGTWINENELATRIWRSPRESDEWHPAESRGSFCVWDLEVMWHERNTYVRHVLREDPNLGAYMGDWIEASAEPSP
ncbi:MAG: hypothetical protein H6811_02280 [Phycisphaeraceae bacterium]|nr:hypothetical protein [Phycisphaeraceae bacterium]